MKENFEHRKIFASVIFCVLSEGTFVTTQEPKFQKPTGKGTFYSINFQFIKPFGEVYSLEGKQLKYTDYKSVLNDIKAFDTVHIKTSDHEIYQLAAKGKNYINLAAVLDEETKSYRFMIFCRIMICIAALPIFFFKNRPEFWHSGFQFDFRFSYLFFAIMIIAIWVYIYINGSSYLAGFQPD